MPLPVLVAGIVALIVGSMADDAGGRCGPGGSGCGAIRLPAAITVTAGRVSYRIARDGRVTRVAVPRSPFPPGVAWFPATGTWYLFKHHHLVVGRGRHALWRSHVPIALTELGLIVAGRHQVAFQHDHRLYLARYGGIERPVAPRELPLGFTSHGLYTYSYPRRALVLRNDSGRLVRTIARRPHQYAYDPQNSSLYYLRHGVLFGVHGVHARRLASLSSLGMSAGTWVSPTGPLLELLDENRVTVVRPDGSLFASTSLPRDGHQAGTLSGSLTVAPRAGAVAFTEAFGQAGDPRTGRRARGTETVYLLRAGDRAATIVHVEPVRFAICERGADLQWHGSWLLYGNTEGNVVAIETAGAHRSIDLTRLVRRRFGSRQVVDATWSR